jgi:hypothetical protein
MTPDNVSFDWICRDSECGETVMWRYSDLAASGNPVCPKSDDEMELNDGDQRT